MSDWQPLYGPLAAARLGDGERVAFCHGFTQTSSSWRPLAAQVARLGYECVVVDLPGHGGSATVRADLRMTADLLTATVGTASYVGYSLGGRLCLTTALAYPDRYLRHINSEVWIATQGGNNPWDGNPGSFLADTTWSVDAPWAP